MSYSGRRGRQSGPCGLSIIDLDGGSRTLQAARSTIVGNDEIYSYLELTQRFGLTDRLSTGSDFEPLQVTENGSFADGSNAPAPPLNLGRGSGVSRCLSLAGRLWPRLFYALWWSIHVKGLRAREAGDAICRQP